MGENNCMSNCGRVLLVVLNILFLIIGFVLMILGILVYAYTPALEILFSTAIGAFGDTISGEAGAVFDAANLVSIVQAFAFALIGFGVFFFVIALMGIIGGCCKVKCVLIVYIILMVLLVVGQIALLIIVFASRDVIDSNIKAPLVQWTDKYTGFDGKDGDTVTLNFLMLSLGCCGVDSYQDFKRKPTGNWNGTFNGQTIQTPAVCCVNPKQDLPDCANMPDNSTVSNAKNGCYSQLWTEVDNEEAMVIGISCAIIILQVILLLFAVYIVYREGKSDSGMI